MKSRKLLLPMLLVLACGSLQAQQAVSLAQQMGDKDFKQAGLDQLSPTQLQHLQQWLAQHAAELAAAVPASDATSATAAAGARSTRKSWLSRPAETALTDDNRIVSSQIVGDFKGWQHGTTLVLRNGQKWRVKDDSSLTVRKPIASPEVTIKPGMLGSWMLKVQGYNSSARVEPAN